MEAQHGGKLDGVRREGLDGQIKRGGKALGAGGAALAAALFVLDAAGRPVAGNGIVGLGMIGVRGGRSCASRQLLPALLYLPTSLWVAAARDTGTSMCGVRAIGLHGRGKRRRQRRESDGNRECNSQQTFKTFHKAHLISSTTFAPSPRVTRLRRRLCATDRAGPAASGGRHTRGISPWFWPRLRAKVPARPRCPTGRLDRGRLYCRVPIPLLEFSDSPPSPRHAATD